MEVMAWSENLSLDTCKELGVLPCSKEDLIQNSDFISIHVQGGERYKDCIKLDEFDKMKKLCWETIEQLDHRNLNELFDFPTSENITEWIFDNLKDKVPLHSVKFFEGTNKYCEITSD